MESRTNEQSFIRIWFYCYPVLFGLAYSQNVLFTSNQNTKFISGLALAGYRDVASTWMANITDPFPLFSNLLKWQYQLFGLHVGIHSAFFLLVAAYGITGVWLAKNLTEHYGNRTRCMFVFSSIWMFIHTVKIRDYWLRNFPDGLAGQYILDEYYQPCVFGVLLLTGTAAYFSKRTILAAVCLLFAALIHPTYLMSSALIAVTIALVPANRLLEISWRKRLVFLSIFFVIIGVYAVWMVDQLSSGDPLIRKEAHKLLAETRIPHHAVLSEWNLRLTVTFMVVGFGAAWLDRKRLLGQLILVLMLIVTGTILWAKFAYSPTLAVAAPWRISAYIAPLSWIVLLSFIAQLIQREISKESFLSFNHFMKVSVVGVSIASLAGIAYTVHAYENKKDARYYSISRYLEDYHQPGNQYLVPINEMSISLEAGVPVFATWKSHPTKDSEFLEWYDRIETARSVYETKLDEMEIVNLLKTHLLTHIVWPETSGDYPYAQMGRRIYIDVNYSLWDMR